MTLAGVILAAGESRRMGTPKALLRYRGETFLDSLIGVLSGVCHPVVVVLGHEPQRTWGGARRSGEVLASVNRDWPRGQLSSLQCGLRALPANIDAVMFTPVDCPAVRRETILRVAAALDGSPACLVVPRHEGRRGHPVCVRRPLIDELLGLPKSATARDVIRPRLAEALYIDTDDAGVVDDIDDPAEYRRLLAAGGEG